MVLIIDDDIAVRTSLQLLLETEGFEVHTAANQPDALMEVKSHQPELIILDLNFSIDTSGREGMKLLREIKKLNAAVPIILITGWATIELAVEGMKTGANDFLNKPWNNDHLLQCVKTLINLEDKKPAGHNRKQLDALYQFGQIIGEDRKMLDILETG